MPAQDFSGQLEPRPAWDLIQYRIVALFQFPMMISFCRVSSSLMLAPGNNHRNNGPAQWVWHHREEAGNPKKCSVAAPISDFFHLFVEGVGKNFLLNPQWNSVSAFTNPKWATEHQSAGNCKAERETWSHDAGWINWGSHRERQRIYHLLYSQYYTDFFFVLYNFVSFWAMLCLYLCRTSSYWIKQ